MRWVQVTLGITLKSYTFFKPLDLSIFNGKKKKKLISFIITYLIHFILISKPKKLYMADSFSLHCTSLSLSLCTFLSLSFPRFFHLHGQFADRKKKKKLQPAVLC